MKKLATFIMQGPSQAVLVTSGFALLSLILPLLGLLSAASIGLVTLRLGAKAGFSSLAWSTLACGLFLLVSVGNPIGILVLLLLQWLPMIALALFLRSSRSMDMSVQMALLMGILVIAGLHLTVSDPMGFWKAYLQPLGLSFEQAGLIETERRDEFVGGMAVWMSGILATGSFLHLVSSLFLARWWQSLLYNPGGFKKEFLQLRLHRIFGLVGLLLLVVMMLPSQELPQIVKNFTTLLVALFFIQGLAVVHGMVEISEVASNWLVLLYLLLIVLMPQMVMLLATLGLADIWVDLRARLKQNRSTG
jgi:hypothetical protein